MEITDIRYYYNQGYPQMDALIDGARVIFPNAFKPIFLENKMVLLGEEWEDHVPPITIRVDDEDQTLFGFTQQKDIFKPWLNFKEHVFAGTFDQLVTPS